MYPTFVEFYDLIYLSMKDYAAEAATVAALLRRLDRAGSAKHPAGRFAAAEMCAVHLGRRYDAVVCLFSSIGYARTLARVVAALHCFREHLAADGVVLVEPWCPPGIFVPDLVVRNDGVGDDVRVSRESRVTVNGAISQLHFTYEISDAGGTRRASEVHELGLFTISERLEAFRNAGLVARYDPEGPGGRGLYTATLKGSLMRIALASPRVPSSLDDAFDRVHRLMCDAAAQRAGIVCFPEAYIPGLRGLDFEVGRFTAADEARALEVIGRWSGQLGIAAIVGMEHLSDAGPQIVAAVFDAAGRPLGYQTKNQLDPAEEGYYVPGDTRRLFVINGVTVGIAICHEGFRYPESVRWSATRGARVVFHPHCAGTMDEGIVPTEWGAKDGAYYEKAMMMRSVENTIYFASVNYAFPCPESATSLIDPAGRCQAYLPYGEEGVLVEDLDLEKATGLIAKRFAPSRYEEE